VFLVFDEHLLKIFLLLLSLLLLKTSLCVHLLLQTLHEGNLLGIGLLLFLLAADLLFEQLLVAAEFLLHDALLEFGCLLDLLLLEELHVLLLEALVDSAFLDLGPLSRILLLQLFVQLFLNEALAFAVSQDSLFLLLVVKQGVEFLNCSPLVLLFDL